MKKLIYTLLVTLVSANSFACPVDVQQKLNTLNKRLEVTQAYEKALMDAINKDLYNRFKDNELQKNQGYKIGALMTNAAFKEDVEMSIEIDKLLAIPGNEDCH